jgi:hypothetical protein
MMDYYPGQPLQHRYSHFPKKIKDSNGKYGLKEANPQEAHTEAQKNQTIAVLPEELVSHRQEDDPVLYDLLQLRLFLWES